ncbi:hypothetical protein BJ878DRAFT_477005 [Calycina marina]|uniref:Uncharacterized protein n=1 Tax=Calycina marina TaxID=1763456 RepID=A0A9P7Z9N4_9HELO|nr:hypothetical protein BJ878DRAFT_477005 [Calycina marina]
MVHTKATTQNEVVEWHTKHSLLYGLLSSFSLRYLEDLPPLPHKKDMFGFDWQEKECVHLHFSVTDSGMDMTADEQNILFAHFSQVSAKTHIKYGSSGLVLYIVVL